MIIKDDFLDLFDWFREYCDSLSFEGMVNDADGVEYPDINDQIPVGIKSEIIYKLEAGMGKRIIDPLMFLRLTTTGTKPPHQAHTDAIMGTHGFFLYMNKEQDCQGGTSFVRHVDTGMDCPPVTDEDVALWKRDTNTPDKWEMVEMAEMKENRAVLFDATRMHRAEPVEGFGDCAENGRLVLICFFTAIDYD